MISSVDTNIANIESLCMKCMKQGVTKILLVDVPYFKDVIVSSFECENCGHTNRQVTDASSISPKGGVVLTLKVESKVDLNRIIVKTEYATFRLVDLDFEIPPLTQQGTCNTIEGILKDAIESLSKDQAERELVIPDVHSKIQNVLNELELFASGKSLPFTIEIYDPAGTSLIQPLTNPGVPDPCIQIKEFERTQEHHVQLGLVACTENKEEIDKEEEQVKLKTREETLTASSKNGAELSSNHLPEQLRLSGWDLNLSAEENIEKMNELAKNDVNNDFEPISFAVNCSHCNSSGRNDMCFFDIPGFRKCIIMAFICGNCGAKNVEVKPAGTYGEKAKRWILKCTDPEDLNRDVLKSDTAALSIPELSLELSAGTLGGVFTTVEGLLLKIEESLNSSRNIFAGDSADNTRRQIFENLLIRLKRLSCETDELPFTIILDDAADMSMISNRYASHKLPTLGESESLDKIEVYERTEEQNDDLGLTHMKTENYEE